MQFTILVVDDDPANIRVLSTLLKNEYKVVVAKSGKSAVEIANSHNPHLILLDIVMPDMNGFDVIKQLKSSYRTQNIPVIFITGLNSDTDQEQGLKLGANDYIHKPFHTGVVKARIKNQLEILRRSHLLEQVADIDALTELPNKRQWIKDLEQLKYKAYSEDKSLAVGILDIDNFKEYNDYYGHSVANQTLLTLAQAIEKDISRCGAQLYRLHGEEFVFLIFNQDAKVIEECVARICPAVEQQQIEHKTSKVKPFVTVSGAACIQPLSKDICSKRMFEQADKLLYKVKQQGKNHIKLSHTITEERTNNGI